MKLFVWSVLQSYAVRSGGAMQTVTPCRYWERVGNRQYVRQIQEIQKLGGKTDPENKMEGRTVEGSVLNIRNGVSQEPILNSVPTGKTCGRQSCNEEAAYDCEAYNTVNCCSRDHQKTDWGDHRRRCKLYEVTAGRDGAGSMAVARFSLDETYVGCRVFEEKPLVVLPQAPSEGDYLVCIGCCKPVSWGDKLACCSLCSWPVCHGGCDREDSLHSKVECNILEPVSDARHWKKRGGYESLWMIRIISLKSIDRNAYDRIMKIEVDEGMFGQKDVVPHRYFAAQTLRRMYDIHVDSVSDEELNQVWNVLRLKCFNNVCSLSAPFKRSKLLFEVGGKFSHSCCPNALYKVDSNFKLQISLQSPVEAGQPLSINYDSALIFQPTRCRHARLNLVYKIHCSCFRCNDPSELGTYFDGIPCHSKKSCSVGTSRGYLIQMNGQDPQSPWQCSRCHSVQLSNLEVQSWLYSIQQGLESVCENQDPYQLCIFIGKLVEQQVLHKNHHLVFTYYVETLKILHKQVILNPAIRHVEELLKYRQAATCVCKILRLYLPNRTNLVGPVPQISILIQMAGIIETLKAGAAHPLSILQDLKQCALETGKDIIFVLRNEPPEKKSMEPFIQEVMTSLSSLLESFTYTTNNIPQYQTLLENLKYVYFVVQNNSSHTTTPAYQSDRTD